MIVDGLQIITDETRALRTKCSCGRFDVRRVYEDKKASYVPPKDSSGHNYGFRTHYRKSHPAYDGLCARCHAYGSPDEISITTTGRVRSETHANCNVGRRAVAKIGLNLREEGRRR